MVIHNEGIRVLSIEEKQITIRTIQSDGVSHKLCYYGGSSKYLHVQYDLNKDIGFCKIKRTR